jgi:hypothetical protein
VSFEAVKSCLSCGYDIAGLDSGVCPECGRLHATPTADIDAIVLAASQFVRLMLNHEIPGQPVPVSPAAAGAPQSTILPLHLLLALLTDPTPSIQACLAWSSTDAAYLRPRIIAALPRVSMLYFPEGTIFELSSESRDILTQTLRTAEQLGETRATPEHLLYTLIARSQPDLAIHFANIGISLTNLQSYLRTRHVQPGAIQAPELRARVQRFFKAHPGSSPQNVKAPNSDSQSPCPQPSLSSRLLSPLLNLLRTKPLPPLVTMPFSLPIGTPHDDSNPFHLPADLIAFLAANRQLEYNADTCKAGAVTLLPLAALSLGELKLEDPPRSHRDLAADPFIEVPVPAVNLIASAVDYSGEYFLCWLPTLRLFANADVEHREITIFPDVSWTTIAANPSRYLDAQWQTRGWRRLLASDIR